MWLHEIIKLLHSKENNQRKRWPIEWYIFDRLIYVYIHMYMYIYKEFLRTKY